MKIDNVFYGLVCLLGMISNNSFGQSTAPDSSFLSAAVTPLRQRYNQAATSELHLYNGTEYVNYDKYYIRGHQFFKSNEAQEGRIYYDNSWFTGVPLLYDIQFDQIVLEHPTTSLTLKLINEKVGSFTVHGHTFIRLVTDTLTKSAVQTGFYDLLANNKVQVLAKRTKNMQEQATPRGMEGWFKEVDKFFIRKDQVYYPVSSKQSVVSIFPDRKKELQRYARRERLKFKKASREAAIVKLVQYYETLPPQN